MGLSGGDQSGRINTSHSIIEELACFGHFGSFFAILGHFWPFLVILYHFGSFLSHFGSFWVIPEPFWAILGHMWVSLGHFGSFLGHFVAFLDKFAESSIFLRDFLSRYPRFWNVCVLWTLLYESFEMLAHLKSKSFTCKRCFGAKLFWMKYGNRSRHFV